VRANDDSGARAAVGPRGLCSTRALLRDVVTNMISALFYF
jgi:hypothetical protein